MADRTNKTNRARNSINRKLTLMLVLTTGISLLLACLAFVAYDVVTLRQAMVRNTSTLAEVIGSNSKAALLFDDAEAAKETLAALTAAEPVTAAVLYDRHGNEFARYVAPGTASTELEPFDANTADHGFRSEHLEHSRNVVFSGQVIGSISIRRSTHELSVRIERYVMIVVLLLGAAAGVAGLVSLRLRRQISQPLTELVEVSEAMADGDLSARVVASTQDEIGVLARTFNAMAAGLRDLVGQARKSTRDVSEVIVTLRASGGHMALEAQRQKAAIDESAESLEQVGASIEEVDAHVAVLAESARDTSSSILEMDASIGTVAEHMDHLSSSIETTSGAVNQVAVNTDQVVQGVETLTQATEGTIECVEQLSLSVRQVQTNAAQSHALSEDSSAEASQGTTAVNETIIAMREISTGFAQLEASVLRLAEKSQAIDEIIQVIQGVADQTTGRADEINSSVATLAERSQRLEQEIGRFKTE